MEDTTEATFELSNGEAFIIAVAAGAVLTTAAIVIAGIVKKRISNREKETGLWA